MTSIITADQIVNSGGSPDHLKGGADKYNRHLHDYDGSELTNQTGGALVDGDVVALDSANNSAVVLSDIVGSLLTFVVAKESIASAAAGEFARSGVVASVKSTGTIARGQYVRKSATSKTVEDAGVAMTATKRPPPGSIGLALTVAAAGTVTLFLFGHTWDAAYLDELTGLTMSNNGVDATNDLDVAVGAAASDDATVANRILLSFATAMTKQIDAVWAAGTAAGGRDSADTLTGAKTFHVYLFRRVAAATDIFISTSAAPTLPDSGTHKRRIGSILWSGSTIRAFTQDKDYFRLVTSILDVSANNPGTAAVTRTLTVPTGINVYAIMNVLLNNATGISGGYFSDLIANDDGVSTTVAPLENIPQGTTTADGVTAIEIRTNTLAQIRSRVIFSDANTNLRIALLGWIDRRGRG